MDGIAPLRAAFASQDVKLRNEEIEMLLVASVMAYPNCWRELTHIKPDDFTDILSADTWRGIADFLVEGRQLHPAGLAMHIYENEADQQAFRKIWGEWLGGIFNPIGAFEYGRIVKDLSDRRKIVAAVREIADLAEDTTCGMNAVEIAGMGVSRLASSHMDCPDFIPAHRIAEKVISGLDKTMPVFKTGFDRLDAALGGGFYQNRFYGIGARMKSGKSLFMSTVAYQMTIYRGARILYLCLEMGAEESMQRIMAMHMGINSLDFLRQEKRTQMWFKNRAEAAREALKAAGLHFRSKPRMTLDDLKAVLARAGMSGKVDGVIVDYLQLVEGKRKDQSSAEHYDNVAQSLAEAVKRYPLWVLSAAQLNKEGTIRGSEGLLMACDLAFSLNKKEEGVYGTGEKIPDRAWLETMVSRYTPYMDIGSETIPGYEIDISNGPRFVELAA